MIICKLSTWVWLWDGKFPKAIYYTATTFWTLLADEVDWQFLTNVLTDVRLFPASLHHSNVLVHITITYILIQAILTTVISTSPGNSSLVPDRPMGRNSESTLVIWNVWVLFTFRYSLISVFVKMQFSRNLTSPGNSSNCISQKLNKNRVAYSNLKFTFSLLCSCWSITLHQIIWRDADSLINI